MFARVIFCEAFRVVAVYAHTPRMHFRGVSKPKKAKPSEDATTPGTDIAAKFRACQQADGQRARGADGRRPSHHLRCGRGSGSCSSPLIPTPFWIWRWKSRRLWMPSRPFASGCLMPALSCRLRRFTRWPLLRARAGRSASAKRRILQSYVFVLDEMNRRRLDEHDRLARHVFHELLEAGTVRFMVVTDEFAHRLPKVMTIPEMELRANSEIGKQYRRGDKGQTPRRRERRGPGYRAKRKQANAPSLSPASSSVSRRAISRCQCCCVRSSSARCDSGSWPSFSRRQISCSAARR